MTKHTAKSRPVEPEYRTNDGMISRRPVLENENRDTLKQEALEMLQSGASLDTVNLLTIERQSISRLLYYTDRYKSIVGTPGVICEFGVQYGCTLNLLLHLRGIYEPYNVSRKIFGFDTFEGFPALDDKDFYGGNRDLLRVGDYSVPRGHEHRLDKLLALNELGSPVSHLKKYELIKGDAEDTFERWLKDHPYAIVSMAIFDMDLYKPTKGVLEKILVRLVKGSVLVFDELTLPSNPGEARALFEVLDSNSLRLQRDPNQSYCSWCVWGE